jgi:hypothetical protein
MRGVPPLVILCQSALEQAVLAAEGPPVSLSTEHAYRLVSEEMIRQSIMMAVDAGVTAEDVARIVAEALVELGRGKPM